MRPALTAEMARAVVDERVEAAERYRRRKEARIAAASHPDVYDSVTVRLAGKDDEKSLERLAQRDGSRIPSGTLLVAEVEGIPLAARSLSNGKTIADPFVHSHHLVELLALRSTHLRRSGDGQPPHGRLTGVRGLVRRFAGSYGLSH
jgi:hypothetical protein